MKEISSTSDVQFLQIDLNAVYKWTDSNNMQLNGLKFKHISYGKLKNLKDHSIYLSDNYHTIETKNQVKDLGVILDANMTYDQHIQTQID